MAFISKVSFARSKTSLIVCIVLLALGFAPFIPGSVQQVQANCVTGNAIVRENCLTGNPASEWDISGAGDASIQGFSTDISVNAGEIVSFKIDTTATSFLIDIYRIGYYNGDGARKVTTIADTETVAQDQEACLNDALTGLNDCGNWDVSASWQVPADAVSGVYIAKLVRTDSTAGASHIIFIVRDDEGASDLLFQTSDTTWQAYNQYGGNSLYVGSPAGRAYKVSYNRPFTTRGTSDEDWFFNSEYPMVRWLEANGYDVSYFTGVDTDRYGAELLEHKAFLSVGHDEYWSGQQRANVEAARDAVNPVHLAFFSGNEIFWKTRWEASIDGSDTDYRTLVTYKETKATESIDPTEIWTGTWRDQRSFNPELLSIKPENVLTGTIFYVNSGTYGIDIPADMRPLRFWRGTGVASGTTNSLPSGLLGYEWDIAPSNDYSPAGLIRLSATTVSTNEYLQDEGNTYSPGVATHSMTLYRAASGALVFGSGTIQWPWGLDSNHDRGNDPANIDVQQATVNLFADMDVQPETPQVNLNAAAASTDDTAPTSSIVSPLDGATVEAPIVLTGTAADSGGVVGAVEVSIDNGTTWRTATGRENWTYTFNAEIETTYVITSRAVDDSGNIGANSAAISITAAPQTCPCSIWGDAGTPALPNDPDLQPIEVGVKFQSSIDGYITGLRFYKGILNTGTHVGHLWTSTGTLLAEATFSGESASGWQEVSLGTPVQINANTTYVASYHTPVGRYASTDTYFTTGVNSAPLQALADGEDGANGVYRVGTSAFPNQGYNASNYWVDVVFEESVGPDTSPPVVIQVTPSVGQVNVVETTIISVVFSESVNPATVNPTTIEVRDSNNALVIGALTYNAITRTATFDPDVNLGYLTDYTVVVKGGAAGVKDLADNALAADYSWGFTVKNVPPPPPDEGPGGPVLVISSATNPFGRYYAEILRAEGLNLFTATDISLVNATVLAEYDVVILGEMPLTAPQVTFLSDWVTAGGNLIAMRPDAQLAGLLGLTDTANTLAEGYLLVNTAAAPGAGIVNETIQYHGTADIYTTSGANVIATLYSNATTATSNPAVTLVSVGTNGGQAAAFTYDLAKSTVYIRQGNPEWAGQKRDTSVIPPIRSNDLFFGNAPFDPQTDWANLDKVAIPQADEQQRLLANLILTMNADKKPLPHFWYLPRGEKAAVVMSGDDHAGGGTVTHFNTFIAASPVGCSVADWECVRGTSYIYTNTPISDVEARSFQDQGFEIALHPLPGCDIWTESSITATFPIELAQWGAKYTLLNSPVTNRNHCIAWSDWSTQPTVEAANGIRMDTNYYYYPGSWIQNRPGMFTGSGMPMRFADINGNMIDVYQATTQLTDESDQNIPLHIATLLDNALGQTGYYGVFTANMHTDRTVVPAQQIVAAAQQRGVPVISARQLLEWVDGRNNSSFSGLTWDGNTLAFTVNAAAGSRGLQMLIPYQTNGADIQSISRGSTPVSIVTETVKGVVYARVDAAAGSYSVVYGDDLTGPTVTTTTPTQNAADISISTSVSATFSEALDPLTVSTDTFAVVDEADVRVAGTVSYNASTLTATFTPTDPLVYSNAYTVTLQSGATGVKDAAGNPLAIDYTWSFTTSVPPPQAVVDTTAADFNAGTVGTCAVVTHSDNGEVILSPALLEEFSGTTLPSGWLARPWVTGTATVGGGHLVVNGTRYSTETAYSVGQVLEFVATFPADPYAHIGFGGSNLILGDPNELYNNPPWAMFSTGTDGLTLQARTALGGTTNNISLAPIYLGSPHRYRIEWLANEVVFYIDGVEVSRQSITLSADMYVGISDYTNNAPALDTDWVLLSPFSGPCTFTSRVLDAGTAVNWQTLSWVSAAPAGTGLTAEVRTGDTSTPDGTWSAFTPITSGSAVGSTSRYIQYRMVLSSTNGNGTPEVQSVSITYGTESESVPPTVTETTPTTNATDILVDSSISATFSEALNPTTITADTFEVLAGNVPVAGTVSYNVSTFTASFVPTSALANNRLYTVTLQSGTAGIKDVAGNPLATDYTWSFTTAAVPTQSTNDTTVLDFGAGTTGTCAVTSHTGDGEVILSPTLSEEFTGTTLPATWENFVWNAGAGTSVAGDSLTVDGTRTNTTASYSVGRSIEFVATFNASNFQTIGFGQELATNSEFWAVFGTASSTSTVYARVNNGGPSSDDVAIPLSLIGTPHRYRIEWDAAEIRFYVDGVIQRTAAVSISANMRPVVSDYSSSAPALSLDWMQMSPFSSPCTFTSRVMDAGSVVNWQSLTAVSSTPVGTGIGFEVRTGNTAAPDGTWSAFTPVVGTAVSGQSRYIQYRALLSTSNPNITPELQAVSLNSGMLDVTPPVISTVNATANTSDQAVITWTTDEVASSRVDYGVDANNLMLNVSLTPLVTSHSVTLTGLTANTTYYYRVASADEAINTATQPQAPTAPISFTTPPALVVCPCSIWDNTAAAGVNAPVDFTSGEFGFRFRSSQDGYISSLRFYKHETNTGTHIGNLYTNTGTLLASVNFTSETASGWQEVTFSQPIAITANTTYVASYFSSTGRYTFTSGLFANSITNGPLTALANGIDGANGVYQYSATSTFPTQTFGSSHYWVDVVFIDQLPADTTAPIISSVNATATASDQVVITWTTDEAASSRVDYGTDENILTQNVIVTPLDTSHSVTLTGLTANTTYYYRVTSADAATNAATQPQAPTAPNSFTTFTSQIGDTTSADFSAGSGDCLVISLGDGAVSLAPTFNDDFNGAALSSAWQSSAWEAGGSTPVAGGSLTVSAARAMSSVTYNTGADLDFTATFTAQAFQNIGFAQNIDFDNPWVTIGTNSGDGVYARNNAGSNISLGAGLLGSAHRYRIVWTATQFEFYVDGASIPSATLPLVTGPLHVLASDYAAGSTVITIDSLQILPYSSPCTFQSRIIDAGDGVNWGVINWLQNSPDIQVSVRTGNTPIADGSWTAFASATNGERVGQTARYLQYQAMLSTANLNQSPILESVQFQYTANQPPVLAAIGNQTVNEGDEQVVNITAIDPDGTPLTITTSSLPAFVTFANISDGAATLTFNPTFTAANTYSITVTVSDGAVIDDETFEVVVNNVNRAPVAVADSYTTDEDEALTVIASAGVLGNDTDADGDTLNATVVSATVHGALTLNLDGSFTYTPVLNYNGEDSFTYMVNDGEDDSNEATVTITVVGTNDAPLAVADSYSVAEDATLTVAAAGLLGNDTDLDGDALTATVVSSVAHGTLTLNANGSFTYTPNGNYNGEDSFTYVVSDNEDESNEATVTITVTTVNDAPVAVGDSYNTDEDTVLTVDPIGVLGNDTAVDGDALTATLVTTTAHGALILNANGSFTYTPVLNYNGEDSFTYVASDGDAESNVATVTITVGGTNDAPIAVGDSYSTDEDTALTIGVAAGVLGNDTDADGDALTATVVSTTAHGALTLNLDGSFTYTPDTNYNGEDSFTYTASDGDAESNVATVTITVTAVNDAPIAVADSYSVAEDATLTVAAAGVLGNDSDADGDTLTTTVVASVTHGTLTLNVDGSFTYTPDTNYNGGDSFTYTASDGDDESNVATVTITVTAVNDAPIAVGDSYSTDEDAALTVAAAGVLGNDTDVDGDALSATLVTTTAHGTLTLNSNGSFTYTPALNYNGEDSFTYTASDGDDESNVATVTIMVTAVNDLPVAVADSYSTDEDAALTVAAAGVLGNDTDVDGDTLNATVVSTTVHGALTLNLDGSFTYTPALNYNGEDSFTYMANDGEDDSNVATVTITVVGTNDAPVAVGDSYNTDEDTVLTVDPIGVLGNDTDADGDALTATVVSTTAHGTLTLNLDGSFTYTPALNYNGEDSFTYMANDGEDESNVATVTITVMAVNDLPVAVADSYTTDEDEALTVIASPGVLGNDTDADGDTLNATVVSATVHGALTLNTNGSFTYTPDANYNGEDNFTYTANDGDDESNVATVTITVGGMNDAPVAVGDSYTTDEDTVLTVDPIGVLGNDTDADGDALTATVVSTTAHGTLTLNLDGSFTYTPMLNYNGGDSFTYMVNDGEDDSNVATVTITVTAVNDAPIAVADSYSVAEDATLTVAAAGVLGNDSDADGDTLTTTVVASVTHGTLTLNVDGSFTYTPDTNYNGGDSFTYTASDGDDESNVATVSITVTAVNDAPIAVSDSFSVVEDATLTVAATGVLDNDTDVDGDALTATLVTTTAHGTLTLNLDGSFTYTPDTNYNGGDSFTYTASDGDADSNVATVTIIVTAVNDAPITVADSYSTDEDTALTIGVAAGVLGNDTDADGDTLNATLVTTTAHGTLTLNSNGSFTYTPALNYNGEDNFTYMASDGDDEWNVATVTITVGGTNDAPIAVGDSYSTDEDTVLTIDPLGVLVNDTDADGDALTATVVSTTAHGTLTLNSNGSFTYTPDANYNGEDSFTYMVNDGDAESNVATVTITVVGTNDAPVAVGDSYNTDEDTVLTVDPIGVLGNDTDADGDALTATLVTTTAHGTLTLNSNGSFTYTPALNYNGEDNFTYTANDGDDESNVATVTITVVGTNDAPVAVGDSYNTDEDTVLTVDPIGVLGNDTDADGDALTATVVSATAHGALTLNLDGSFTYTPDTNYNGEDSFTYTASDGDAESNVVTVTITVGGTNDAPIAVGDSYSTDEDTVLTVDPVGVLGNDTDADGDALTATVVSTTAHGTLTLNLDGSFTYTPALNYNGEDSFTYVANDSDAESNVAMVTITVGGTNDAPIAVADSYSTDEDTALTVDPVGVLGNDTDVDGDALTVTLVSATTRGTVVLETNGSFTYTPNANYNGEDSFTYVASDSDAESNVATVTITVGGTNDVPIAVGDNYNVAEDATLTVAAAGVLGNDSDADGDALTATVVTTTAHGALTLNLDGSFTYTPDENYNGTDSFTYTANDDDADSNVATVTITVGGTNDVPIAVGDSYSVAEDATLTVAAVGVLGNDSDADGDILTGTVLTTTAHGTLTLNANGSFTYVPNANYNGEDNFTYTASDSEDESNIVTVTISVMAVNDAPIAVADSYSTDEDTALTIGIAAGVLGNDTDVDGDVLTTAVVMTTGHGMLSLNANGSFTYTPDANYNGEDSFTYVASDGDADSNVATVTITVMAVNDAPIAVADSYSTDEDTALTIGVAAGVLGNDTDADGDVLTTTVVTTTAHGALTLNLDGSFTYRPALNYNGEDRFTYTASDGDDESNVATVTISVMAVNDLPVAVADSYSVAEDATLTVAAAGVLGNDTDVDGDVLTATLLEGATHGLVTLNANGSFTYTPVLNYNGEDSFTYTANDGADTSNVATVTITVTAVNDLPVAVADSYSVAEDATLTVAAVGVLGNDTDADGDILTATVVTTTAHGTLTLNLDGAFTYTPDRNYNGTDSFTYVASDGDDESNIVTVTITLTAVNDTPMAAIFSPTAGNITAGTNGLASVVLNSSGTFDIEDSLGQLNFLWNWTENGNPVTQTAAGFIHDFPIGIYTISLTVTDTSNLSSTATVAITVVAGNTPPFANAGADQTVTDTDNNGTQAVTLNGSLSTDVGGSIVSYAWTEGVTALATGVSPTVNLSVGVHTITLTVTDNLGATGTDTVVITVVAPANQPPVANAGADQTVTDTDNNGTQAVTLNGSLSTDVGGSIVSYAWTEGVTALATGVSPTVNLSVGVHTITLTVTDNLGATGTDTVVITVVAPANQPPVANAGADQTVTDTDNNGTQAVTLNGSFSTDVGGSIASYAWTEGVTALATGVSPTVNLSVGVHTITLTVTDNLGATGTDTVVITVVVPIPSTGTVNAQINTSGDDVNEDGTTLTANGTTLWVGRGSSTTSVTGLRFNGINIPQGATITSAQLQVYSSATNWITVNITIAAEATNNSAVFTTSSRPSARAATTAQLISNTNVQWLANTWYSYTGLNAMVQEVVNRAGWQSGNSLSIIIRGAGSIWARKFITAYDGNPTFAPKLLITYTTLGAGNTSPVANAGADQTVTDTDNNGTQAVTLNGSLSTDVGGSIVSYAWTEGVTALATGVSPTVNLSVGVHTITLTVTDNLGATGTDTVVITVVAPANQPPVANAGADQTVTDTDNNGTQAVTLNGSLSTDVGGSIVSYAWTEGVTVLATGVSPTVNLSVGVHTITLTVTDNLGATGTDTVVITVVAPANQPPVANAGADQTVTDTDNNGTQAVTLNGSLSTDVGGSIANYAWTEGVTALATGVSPTVNLSVGVHTITLTVTDNLGATGTDTVVITVVAPANQPPVANAGADQTVTDTDNNGTQAVTLNGSLSTDVGGSIVSYAWTEGVTALATGVSPTVNLSVGVHTITLTVTDNLGATGTDTVVITVVAPANQPPVANAGADQTVTDTDNNGTQAVTLNGSLSTDVGGSIVSYAWTEGVTALATGVSPTVNLSVGVHTITLTVTDNLGATGTDTVVITVVAPANQPPVANAGADQTVTDTDNNGTQAVTLNGSLSTDVGGSIVSYAWTEGVTVLATGVSPTVNLSVGVHTITLTVTDNLGATGTDTVVITVVAPANQPPVANAGADQTVTDTDNNGTQAVTLNGSLSTDVGGSIANYAWTEGVTALATGVSPTVNLSVGVHTITLTVTDNLGATGTDTVVITVVAPANQPPVANAGADQTVTDTDNNGTQAVTLNGSLSTDVGGSIVSYAWTEGVTALATGVSPTVNLSVGVHTITLTVTDNLGATGTDTVVITVVAPANQPPVANAGADQTVTDTDNNGTQAVTLNGSLSTDVGGSIVSYAWTEGVTALATGVSPTVNLSVGVHTITLTVTDNLGATGTDTVVITVVVPIPSTGTVNAQINTSGDDVNEDGTTLTANGTTLWVGRGSSTTSVTGLRFNGINIPQGATITSAQLQVYSSATNWITVNITIAAEAANNSAVFTTSSRPSARAATIAQLTSNTNVQWLANTWYSYTGLNAMVQEVVNRAGWQSGNSLSIIIRGAGSIWARKFITAYDGNPTFAPKLVITYTTPSQPVSAILQVDIPSAARSQTASAAFTSNVNQGAAPLTVQFTNQSAGSDLSFIWNFGDGAISTEFNPTHTFATSGNYAVVLMASNREGAVTSQSVISVGGNPVALPPRPIPTPVPIPVQSTVAAFTSNVGSGTAPLVVQFSSQSSGDNITHSWNFGDGATSTEVNALHTFAAGTYTVVLTVTGTGGVATAQITISVAQPVAPPSAAFTTDVVAGTVPLMVQFSSQSSGDNITHSWNFGDGTVSTEANPLHIFTAPGAYTVILSVSNGSLTTTAQNLIQVVEVLPEATIAVPEASTHD